MSDFVRRIPAEALFGECVQTTIDLIRQGPREIAREERWLKTWALNGFRVGADSYCRDAAQELLERMVPTNPKHLDATLILIRSAKLKNDILPIFIPKAADYLLGMLSRCSPVDKGLEPNLDSVRKNIGLHISLTGIYPNASAFGSYGSGDVTWLTHLGVQTRSSSTPTGLLPVCDLIEAATS